MSVFGSLFTAVSGLSAQSSSLSTISNNIANVDTTAYKEVNSSFESLVTTQSGATAYSSGSVIANTSQSISQQGTLQQTTSSTNVAISGNGFFVVKATPSTSTTASTYYTRDGSFEENDNGDLVNSAGYYLMGWPLDQNGNPPANQANISSVVPVNVAFLGGLTQATTTASIDINLNSSAANAAYPVAAGTTPSYSTAVEVYDSLGTGNDLGINFTKMASPTSSITGQTNLSSVTGDIAGTVGTITKTDSFSVEVDNPSGTAITSKTITLSGSVADMLQQINAIVDPTTNEPLVTAQIDPTSGGLEITANDLGDQLKLADVSGTPLESTGVGLGIANQFQSQALGGVDLTTLIGTQDLDSAAVGFTDGDSFSVTDGANPPVTITIGDPTVIPGAVNTLSDMLTALNVTGSGFTASIDSATGFLDVRSTDGQPVVMADVSGTPLEGAGGAGVGDAGGGLGMANFMTNGSGGSGVGGTANVTGTILTPSTSPSLLTPLGTTASPNADGWWNVTFTTPDGAVVGSGAVNFLGDGELNATDTSTNNIPVTLSNINWGDGSEAQNINFNIAGFTQFASDYNVVSSTQNGAALGLQTGISIDSSGYVIAQFSNGESQKIYQLPVATFSDPDGLQTLTGNVYSQTDDSGTYNLRESNSGGAGTISGGELEESNVDLATEFAQMIVTQQAYSANSKVITTADQMIQSLLQITG
jgi:flagellar hook protein FlgE